MLMQVCKKPRSALAHRWTVAHPREPDPHFPPPYARDAWLGTAPSHQDMAMTTPSFREKCGCGKQLSFSGTFTQDPAVRDPFPGCSLVRGCAAAPAVSAWGKTCGEVIGSHHLLGLGGAGGEIFCAASLWVSAELVHGVLRQLLCTFASTVASGQRRLSLRNSVGIAHTQSMAGFGKNDFHSCIIIRLFCNKTDFGPLIFLKQTQTS